MRNYKTHFVQNNRHTEGESKRLEDAAKTVEEFPGVIEEYENGKELPDLDIPEVGANSVRQALIDLMKKEGRSMESVRRVERWVGIAGKGQSTAKPLTRDDIISELRDGLDRSREELERPKNWLDWGVIGEKFLEAHCFTFEGQAERMLQRTSAAWPDRFPFDCCYLDVDLPVGNWVCRGITVLPLPEEKTLIATFLTHHNTVRDTVQAFKGYRLLIQGEVVTSATKAGVTSRDDVRLKKAIKSFVSSWASFIMDPDVLVTQTHRSPNAKLKLERSEGHAPKSMRAIRLTGTLKRYVSEQCALADEQERRGVRVHWVRGHFRHLTAERYSAEVRGTRTWIPPHIRGMGGALKRRIYEVSPSRSRP